MAFYCNEGWTLCMLHTQVNPRQPIASASMSPSKDGNELRAGKYACMCGLCQCVTCNRVLTTYYRVLVSTKVYLLFQSHLVSIVNEQVILTKLLHFQDVTNKYQYKDVFKRYLQTNRIQIFNLTKTMCFKHLCSSGSLTIHVVIMYAILKSN